MTQARQSLTLSGLVALPAAERKAALAADAGHTVQLVYQAACHGLPEAQTTLGQMLLDGRGTPADGAAARRWFALAAQHGHAPAANMLGRCLERGWGGEPDMASAARLYRQGAETGLDWAQYNLANMLLRGRGLDRDVPQSWSWFLAAAEQGHAKSMNLVARFLEGGWLGQVDLSAAEAWYRRAADGGDFRAQYNLATLLVEQGRTGEALSWLDQAGVTGSEDFRRIAADQLLARTDPRLHAIGLRIASLCCERGNAEDYYRYGTALAAGPSPQPKLSRAWLRRAYEAGHSNAATALAGVEPAASADRPGLLRWTRRRHREPAP
ncbi:tetratricopeptide repeat protein [Acidisphaera sp. L21]|uniref:tetratricopeptide repeat protein n=1 Tax=Acidisphaera sp. L21 TaxID=1641851 RepID=UPI00131DF30C|nr:tetratricopeptide repeat protein [Acidisphaera sp. L21]